MVKFVCYALRFVADAEARMAAREDGNECSDGDSEDDEDGEEESDSASNADDDNNDDDEDDFFSDADGSRPANNPSSSQREKDLMKDARELFRWTVKQKELVVAL
jgi:hypothetical protein